MFSFERTLKGQSAGMATASGTYVRVAVSGSAANSRSHSQNGLRALVQRSAAASPRSCSDLIVLTGRAGPGVFS